MATSDGAGMLGATERLRDFGVGLRHGNAQAALAAARDACVAQPNMADAHYAFGQVWVAAGEPARAEQAFATAIRLRPNAAALLRPNPCQASDTWCCTADRQQLHEFRSYAAAYEINDPI
jgi:hypothetical protein